MWILFAFACASCFQPPSSAEENNEEIPPPPEDDDTAEDTAGTQEGPPELCAVEEIEPDDDPAGDYGRILSVPMESYACGNIDVEGDTEWFEFTTTEGGWMKFDAQAAARGSSADLMYQLFMTEGGDETTRTLKRQLSSDPLNVWLAPGPGTYNVFMGETEAAFGDEYRWWVLPTMTKAPVEYGKTEEQLATEHGRDSVTHGSYEERLTLTVRPQDAEESQYADYRVFGHLGENDEQDWYYVAIPPGATSLHLEVDAWEFGSAADMQMDIWWDDDGVFGNDDDEHIWTDNYGHSDYDHDPWAEICTNLADHVGVVFELELDPAEQVTGAGMFHWYTIEAFAEYGEAEDEACK
ncbi:MAG: hypothetical protein FJ102_05470 [Deltaproteobacteria bacterium]|nr:hypothetical protein [Deltaproteobacteria bacterium]